MIRYIAVARASDCQVVCSFVAGNESGNSHSALLMKVLQASSFTDRMQDNSRHSLRCDPNKLHFTADRKGRVFCVLADMDFPAKDAFRLIDKLEAYMLENLASAILTSPQSGLDRQCRSYLFKLADTFDDKTGNNADSLGVAIEQWQDVNDVNNPISKLEENGLPPGWIQQFHEGYQRNYYYKHGCESVWDIEKVYEIEKATNTDGRISSSLSRRDNNVNNTPLSSPPHPQRNPTTAKPWTFTQNLRTPPLSPRSSPLRQQKKKEPLAFLLERERELQQQHEEKEMGKRLVMGWGKNQGGGENNENEKENEDKDGIDASSNHSNRNFSAAGTATWSGPVDFLNSMEASMAVGNRQARVR